VKQTAREPRVHRAGSAVFETRLRVVAENAPPVCEARRDGGAWVAVPDRKATGVFVTAEGHVVFYNPRDFRDTRVVSMGACRFGVGCREKDSGKCAFLHPTPESVVPLGQHYPTNRECRYGTSCTAKNCMFAHPTGRVAPQREQVHVLATHSAETLERLSEPRVLELPDVPSANQFLFKGEFAFFFDPHPGAWGKDYARRVTVTRWSASAGKHVVIATQELEGHYCNSAEGCGRFVALSWWPYNEEAVRRNHEANAVERKQQQQIDSLKRQVAARDQKLSKLGQKLEAQRTTIRQQGKQLEASASALESERAQHASTKASEQSLRQYASRLADQAAQREREIESMRQQQQYNRAERLRLADPIHLFAMREGASGDSAEDWQLVLDYHKGAHELEITAPAAEDGSQLLRITEHDTVYTFAITVPANTAKLGTLPIVPSRLCDGF
jgi:hypothetical protein